MSTEYSIVLTTASNPAEATKIAQALLNAKLAACIQINQIKSYYTWQGSINIDDEQQMLIKCKTQDFAEIQDCITANHSYETPEIIQIPITDGSPEYLQWIDESVQRSNKDSIETPLIPLRLAQGNAQPLLPSREKGGKS